MSRILPLLLLTLTIPYQLQAAGPASVNLLSNTNFAILSGAGITTTGGGVINGNVGASPIAGSAIGVTCAQVNGTIYVTSAGGPTLSCQVVNAGLLTQAQSDLTTAYNYARDLTPVPTGPNLNPGAAYSSGYNIGGLTLAPGLYKFGAGQTAFINTDVTLNGGPDDVWIFQCAVDLEVAVSAHVILTGGAQPNNVFWQVGTSATLGTSSIFQGTIMADQSITMGTSSTIVGRALASVAGVVYNGTGLAMPAPIIGVQQPLGTSLVSSLGSNNFGSVIVGTNASLTFTITNSGTANLTGLGVTIDGLDAASFTITTNPVAPVNPGSNTILTVRFMPTSLGVKTAAIHIVSNATTNNPFNLALAGNGTGANLVPGIVVQQPIGTNLVNNISTNNFGSISIITNTSHTFIITNIGTTNLTGLLITIDGTDAVMFSVTTNPVAPLNPGSNTAFTVQFAPASTGLKSAALHIANNDSNNNPFTIALTGTGAAAPAPVIGVLQPVGTNLTNGIGTNGFGSVALGTNTSHTFTITNSGNANLTNLVITIDGTDAAMFSITTNPVAPVNPGSNTFFTVLFTPVIPGVKTAALHIANNDTNKNPFNIALTGTGTNGVIVLATNLYAFVEMSAASNPQTGLFEQTVLVTNTGLTTIAGVRLFVLNLPIDVQVNNAPESPMASLMCNIISRLLPPGASAS